MKYDEVPQDRIPTQAGQRKALYAIDDQGRYGMVPSSGWEPEQVVLDQAVAEFQQQAADAWRQARAGGLAPLAYHMFNARMDLVVLAQASGLFRWQVKRDLQPHRFARLKPARLQRYADALGMSIDELRQLPAEPCSGPSHD